MMTREYQPMSNSYSAPTSKEDASSCLPSNVTPVEITSGPQFDVSMRTSGVDTDPLDPPDAVLGSADTTTQRTFSTAIESNSGLSSTPPTTTSVRRKPAQDNRLTSRLGTFGVAVLLVVGISLFTFSVSSHLDEGPLTVRKPAPVSLDGTVQVFLRRCVARLERFVPQRNQTPANPVTHLLCRTSRAGLTPAVQKSIELAQTASGTETRSLNLSNTGPQATATAA
jgi:hypothetical protein